MRILLALLSCVLARIAVYSPEKLKEQWGKNKTLTTSYANFGIIPYGHSIKGRIYFDSLNEFGCEPFDDFDYHEKGGWFSKPEQNPIIIVRRGSCSFVTKVRNVERAGGHAAIVVDDKFEDVQYVVMSDDGTGSGIRIPSMLVGKSDGQKFIDWIEEHGGTKTKKHVPRPGDYDYDDDMEPDEEEEDEDNWNENKKPKSPSKKQ
jgi:hypothetical protein